MRFVKKVVNRILLHFSIVSTTCHILSKRSKGQQITNNKLKICLKFSLKTNTYQIIEKHSANNLFSYKMQ